MKTLALLVLAALLSSESFGATDDVEVSSTLVTKVTSIDATGRLLNSEVTKRRKRKKSRPAYRRLGSLPAPSQIRMV